MKKGSLDKSLLCKYLEYRRGPVFCPAEHSIYFVNTILHKLSMKDFEFLNGDEGFGPTVQHWLREFYIDTEVYWSLGRDKVKTDELIKQDIESTDKRTHLQSSDFDTFQSWMRRVLLLLNKHFHSGTFLHNLITDTKYAEANFLTLTLHDAGIMLSSYYGDRIIDRNKNIESSDYTYLFRSPNVESPSEYFQKRKHEWEHNYKNVSISGAMSKIKSYCESWSSYESAEEYFSDGIWKSDTKQKCIEESYQAMPHFALMSLHMCNKSLQYKKLKYPMAATRFLSPTIDGKYDSSMAIFWGPRGIPDRAFLYLLSMLLGLNQAAVLKDREEQDSLKKIVEAQKKSIAHYGHTLGHRISPIVSYFEGGSDNPDEAICCSRLIKDMSVVLQAHAVKDLNELCARNKEKVNRFLDTKSELSLRELLEHQIVPVANKRVTVTEDIGCLTDKSIFWRVPSLNWHLDDIIIPLTIEDKYLGLKSRLREAFYAQLLSELLINCVNYAVQFEEDVSEADKKTAKIIVYLATGQVSGKPVLLMSNAASSERKSIPDYLNHSKWELWPSNRSNDGPGMAIGIFRNLKLGEMWSRYIPPGQEDVSGLFQVALYFKDMIIKEKANGTAQN